MQNLLVRLISQIWIPREILGEGLLSKLYDEVRSKECLYKGKEKIIQEEWDEIQNYDDKQITEYWSQCSTGVIMDPASIRKSIETVVEATRGANQMDLVEKR